MKYIVETSLYNFPAWSGGKDTLDDLKDNNMDLDIIEDDISSMYTDDEFPCPSEDAVNSYLWFERDRIATLYGYKDYDELMFFKLIKEYDYDKCEPLIKDAIEDSGYIGITVDAVWEKLCFDNDNYSSRDGLIDDINDAIEEVYSELDVDEEEDDD